MKAARDLNKKGHILMDKTPCELNKKNEKEEKPQNLLFRVRKQIMSAI